MASTFAGFSSLTVNDNKKQFNSLSSISSVSFNTRNNVRFNNTAKTKRLLRGVNELADLVQITLGPIGRSVLIAKNGGATITKDGLTVAKALKLEDPVENIGVDLVTQAAENTKKLAGDGAATTVVLARALFAEGVKAVKAGASPLMVASGMEKTSNALVAELKLMSKESDVVVGGGCAFLRLAAKVDGIKATLEKDEKVGANIVKEALSCPLKLMAENSYDNGSVVIRTVLSNGNPNYGYNFVTSQYEDLIAAGISDPTKVVQCCIEHATSAVKSLLLWDRIIVVRNNSEEWSEGISGWWERLMLALRDMK